MDRRRAAGALLALAACVACSTAAPTASNQTALELLESPTEGCYYNFQHYGEGDRIMTNEPCLNCTCHNRMLMCYLKVCPFTKAIGQDCTIEKRADQCCPIVTCPDVPVDLLTSTSTSSPAEYGGTGLGKVDKYGCSINGKYFPEGSKVPPTPNKPCEHCYCIRNMTTCVMQECTLHVDGCTPIYHKDVCCPVRYSCDHQEDEMLLLDDMTTTVRPTPGFLLTTTTAAVTQMSQDCVHDDQVFADGALIKTEKACEHCYCMKGDIVCVVQECGTPMENEGKNCTSLPPRQGQCCPDTYICEGDELISDVTTGIAYEDLTTLSPPRRVEGSGYRNEPDEPYTEIPAFEGSGEEQATTLDTSDMFTVHKHTPEIIDEVFAATEEPLKPIFSTIEPDKGQNTVPHDFEDNTPASPLAAKTTLSQDEVVETQSSTTESVKDSETSEGKTTISDYHPTETDNVVSKDEEVTMTTGTVQKTDIEGTMSEPEAEKETSTSFTGIQEVTTVHEYLEPSSSEASTLQNQDDALQTDISKVDETHVTKITTTEVPKDIYENEKDTKQEQDTAVTSNIDKVENIPTSTTSQAELSETTSINPVENEIDEDVSPPGRIPGEGDCLLNGITYKNNTSVPNINNCHSSCKCFSSIVKCDPIICSQPPDIMDNMNDCQPIYDTPDACCPTYVCHSRETIPPESHSQMSGTESPKPSSEKPLSGCNGDECPAHETSPELCNSNDCQVQEQVKDCENGLCVEQTEPASDKSPPQKYPEGCIGNNCLPSDDNCIDGKCQQSIITDEICSKENGCQTSEVVSCDGPNCRPDINGPKDEKPEISKPSCEGNSGCDSTKEDSVPIECGDESCRRKEQPQYENPPECLGANCETPEKLTHDVTDVTTEISKDISYKESTTEKIEESVSQSPQPEVTFIDQETPKVTQEEVLTTEKQETSELSTEKSIDGTINEKVERVTEIQQSHTEPSELHVTKSESTVTETYNQPDAEDHSFIPQEYSTQSEEQVTQSFDHITKEMSTEVPLVHEDHSISVTVEVQSSTQEIFTEPIKIPGTKENETSTETNEEFTHRYEIPTESPESHISNIPETDTSEEHTKKQETDTETPEFFTTHLDETSLEKDSITESQPQIGVTESSIPEAHDTFTDQHVYDTGKEDDIVTTVVNKNIDISSPVTIGSLIPVEQTSEGQDTKIEPPVTNKMDADTQTEEAITENPNLYTEKATFETVSEDHLMMEKDFSQKTTQGTLNENVDTESTMSLIKDQQEYTALPDIDETVTNIQGTYTTPKEAQEYMTSTIASDIHVTQPSVTEEKQETQNQEILTTERITSSPTEPSHESAATSISEIIPMKEFSTEHPEITDTTLQPATNVDEPKTTKIPEENFQDDTTRKESVTKDISDKTEEDNIKLKPTSEKYVDETTISSIVLDKDQETSTKYEDEVTIGYIDETTLAPEKAATKFDKTTLPPTRLAESGTETTESSEKHTVGVNDILDKTLTTLKPSEEENVDDKTEAILTDSDEHLYTLPSAASESTEDKESVTVSTVGQKEEVPIFTKPDKPETDEKSSEEMPSEEVTELIDSSVKGDTNKEIFTSTLYPDMRETIAENVETHAPETVTQSQDEDNKLVPELQTEIPPTSLHFDKDDKNTESPMSLVTESDVHMTSPHPIKSEDDSSQIEVEKTTQNNIIVDESSEESLHSPGYHETHKPATEPMQIPESEKESFNETPSPIHHEQENKHDITSTIAAIEITTTNIPDIYKDSFTTSPVNEDVTSSIVTETVQQQAQTIKYQDDVTAVQIPTKSDSEVLHEASTTNPLIEYSEKSTVEQQEGSPRPPGIFTDVTDITIDHELNEKSTDQPLNVSQETSTQGKITETVQEDHTSIYDDNFQQEHTTIPEFVTTKYVETSDSEIEKETTEYKPDKERTSTSVYEENNTTENLPNTVLSESDSDHHTTVEQEKSTAPTQILDTEKDVTTISYDTANTIKEDKIPDAHISTAGVISTESSIDEEDYRRTLSTAKETEGETLTTKKQEIPLKEYTTELPKVSKTEFIEDSDSLHRTSTDTYVKEVTTIPSADKQQEPEYVTSIPQSEEEVLLQTSGTASSEDQDLTVATESIDKHITEDQHITEKPLHTEQDLQTVLPTKDVIFKDDVTDRPTIQDDIVQIPFEETPEKISPQHEVPHESETEHLPTEAETETPSILEIGTSEPHITHTESSTETDKAVSEEMVTVVSDETVTSVPKEIETSLPIETEVTVSKETDTAISIGTESSAAMETETLDITTKIPSPVDLATETSLYKETEPSVSIEIGTETSVPKESQTSIPLKTDITVPVQTETEISVPKETDEFEPTEPTLTKVTEYSQKETETTQEITKPASISDQVKDEKFPEDAVPTSEPISSETTPYSVELQEHTIKLDDDISSDIPVDTFTTKATEIYQTERGDQPLETLDQSTQKEIHEVQTEPTIIEKVEESTTTSPQEQQTDYAMSTSVDEEIPHKTEGVTEEIPLESSVPTLLDTSPGENIPAVLTEEQRLTTIPTVSVTSEHDKVTLESATVKAPEQQDTHETIAPEDELIPTITKATTTGKTMDSTTQFPTVQDRITKPEEKPVESYPSTTGPEEHKPSVNEIQPTEEIPSPDFPPSGTSGYGQEPDYVEEDQAFGPGTCRYGGKVYVSAQQIPRDDPCDFCFCFRSDIICLQQSCPPPIQGCHEEPIQGFCCPRYECPVSMATTLNVTTTTTTTTTTLPPHFLPHAYKGAAQRRGCQIKGHTYKVGDVVKASSGPCLHCTCGGDGQMKCDPKACTPEPMLRQMIAAAVSAKRRR